MKIKNIHIFGGGTVKHIASHLAISAVAYGTTAKKLEVLCKEKFTTCNVHLELTRMAGGDKLETNEDIAERVEELKKSYDTKVVFFNCALCDYSPVVLKKYVNTQRDEPVFETDFGKYAGRVNSHEFPGLALEMLTSEKVIPRIRQNRKDIFLVAFKTTCGASKQEMYEKGLTLCKEASVNLVLVNDVKTRHNMIVTPEEAAYHETEDRDLVLKELVDMAFHRSHLSFTQSTVIVGNPVPWLDERVPASLRTVVNYCVEKNAYKAFKSATIGHFAVKLSDTEFLTSIRKSNFNELNETGLVYVKTDGPDTVLAYGAKPSVGGQSQRIVFNDHPEMDCIVHFHCPLKYPSVDNIPIKSQREVECGSHQCGQQTSEGLKQFGNLKAVYLNNHGPNIVFNKSIDPQEVISFIENNFDLSIKTGGYNV